MSTKLPLFPELDETESVREESSPLTGRARVQMPNRAQMEFRASDLDALLAPDHRVRLVWAYVERLDLSSLYATIKAKEGQPGRPPIAPEILLALWLYATLENVGSARALARLCEEHDAYRWLCGGVSVNHHTLADFRVHPGLLLDKLLVTSVANLMLAGVVKLKRVAQDGMRVRASAGSKSFRRRERLRQFLDEAQQQVARLKKEAEADPAAASRREQAARMRAAKQRERQIADALRRLPELEEAKQRQNERSKKKVKEARASMTDADATIMKMPNAGFNPAYNAQLCTDTESQVIVGANMITSGTDQGQMLPMLEQLEQNYSVTPEEYLVDGGFVSHGQIEVAEQRTRIYAPVPMNSQNKLPPHQPRKGEGIGVTRWRQRMAEESAQKIYRIRAATAECVNALARQRGLTQLRVRGRRKAQCMLHWYALAHNVMRTIVLAPELLQSPSPAHRPH